MALSESLLHRASSKDTFEQLNQGFMSILYFEERTDCQEYRTAVKMIGIHRHHITIREILKDSKVKKLVLTSNGRWAQRLVKFFFKAPGLMLIPPC